MTKKIVAVVEIPLREEFDQVDVDPRDLANTIHVAYNSNVADGVELRRADHGYGDLANFWLDEDNAQVTNSYYVEEVENKELKAGV